MSTTLTFPLSIPIKLLLAMFDEVWFLTTGPLVVTPMIFAEFSVRELPMYLPETLLSRINPIP